MRKPEKCLMTLLSEAQGVIDEVGVGHFDSALTERACHLRICRIEGRLIGLAPTHAAAMLVPPEADIPARIFVEQPLGDGKYKALFLTGWLSEVEPTRRAEIADVFAQRHFTTDLLALDEDWTFLTLDPVEAHYGGVDSGVVIEDETALSVLLVTAQA